MSSGALANPTLDLRDINGALLASNDNWLNDADRQSHRRWIESAEIEAIRTPQPSTMTVLLIGDAAGNYAQITLSNRRMTSSDH